MSQATVPLSMLYGGWLKSISSQFVQELERIESTHNFELGTEFESAILEFLAEVLPSRFGVCRGYVVAKDGESAGDDIIVYDRSRFPTLRLLQRDLGRKQKVPAEAVVAYIEAKHTLHGSGQEGQTLSKACRQVRSVKSLSREPRALEEIVPSVRLYGQRAAVGPGFPKTRNPWFGAIIARKVSDDLNTPEHLLGLLEDQPEPLPDLVIAGSLVAVPAYYVDTSGDEKPRMGLRPTLVPEETRLIASRVENSFGLGIAQLLWAAEIIELGSIPWSSILAEAIVDGDSSFVCSFESPAPRK